MRTAAKWGFLLALAVTSRTLLVHLLGFYTYRIEYADLADRVAVVLPLAAVTFALLERQQELGGTLGIGEGILTGGVVGAISAPLTVAVLWIYHHYVNPDWLVTLVAFQQKKLSAGGMPADQVAARIAQLEPGGPTGRRLSVDS